MSRTARWLVFAWVLAVAPSAVLPRAAEAQEPLPLVSVTIVAPPGGPVVHATLTAVVVPDDPASATSYQWRRCPAGAKSCNKYRNIPGATGPTYKVQPADVGYELLVMASRGDVDVRHRTSVVPPPPEITAVTIDGKPSVGRTLTASAQVTGTATVAYEWLRCDPLSACQQVAVGDSYLVQLADLGHRLAVRATATGDGRDVERSALTAAVQLAPTITSVTIAGTAIVGERLTASATATGDPTPDIALQWLRCGPLLPLACDPIEDETGVSHEITPADAGFRLAVRASAENPAGADTRRSAPSDVVADPPDPGSSFDEVGSPPTLEATPPTGRRQVASLRYLRPFPVIRMKGVLVSGGARVTLLRVSAPRGSRVELRCRQPRCPLIRRPAAKGRVRALERILRGGMRITIRVWKPGLVGKHVRILIRDGRTPLRRDSCVLPGHTRSASCPPL